MKMRKKSRLQFYKVLAVPMIFEGRRSYIWTAAMQ
jgi:hypothetical protein